MSHRPTTARPAAVVVARRVAGSHAPPGGDFTYAVVKEPVRAGGERRAVVRRRTRLRSGKIACADGAFLVECLIANRSAGGGLLRLPVPLAVPDALLLYDDQTQELVAASVVWRRGRDLGIRFGHERGARHRTIADSLRRKFYAVRG